MTDNVKRPRQPHPMQPIVRATDGVIRFQRNAIVSHLVEMLSGRSPMVDYNGLMAMPWSDADRDHFHQLHGYSVSGLPWRSPKRQAEADRIAEQISRKHPGRRR